MCRTASALLLLALAAPARAHAPVFDCFNDDGGQITCEGGFSDGASATGIVVRVIDESGKVLLEGKIDAEGRFAFQKPEQEFQVLFDAGAGHTVTIHSSDIAE